MTPDHPRPDPEAGTDLRGPAAVEAQHPAAPRPAHRPAAGDPAHDAIDGQAVAAAPLGTDDEAGNTGPADPATRARAEAAIRNGRRPATGPDGE